MEEWGSIRRSGIESVVEEWSGCLGGAYAYGIIFMSTYDGHSQRLHLPNWHDRQICHIKEYKVVLLGTSSGSLACYVL
jgi:hypothetical protein